MQSCPYKTRKNQMEKTKRGNVKMFVGRIAKEANWTTKEVDLT